MAVEQFPPLTPLFDSEVDNLVRYLRRHPEAQVNDDKGRLRPLSRAEAERIAQLALRIKQRP